MITYEANSLFYGSGFTYFDVTLNDINTLKQMLVDEIAISKTKTIKAMCVDDEVVFTTNTIGLIEAKIFVNGNYFSKREGITFNEDGTIVLCGWADDGNKQPFLDAFTKWIDYLKSSR